MRPMKIFNSCFLFLSLLIGLFMSCTKDKGLDTKDKELYQLALQSDGYFWYKNSDSLLDKSSGSGHEGYLRTRFNSIASSRLDTSGKISGSAAFPEGSVIIKELFTTKQFSSLRRYAILQKKSDDKLADKNGWVWGYVNPDGTVAHSANLKGEGCNSCHSQGGNVDYVLMKKYFP